MSRIALYCVLLLLCVYTLSCSPIKPEDNDFKNKSVNHCQGKKNAEFNDLCERCAKFVGSEAAYRKCCYYTNGVHNWCKDFLNFRPR